MVAKQPAQCPELFGTSDSKQPVLERVLGGGGDRNPDRVIEVPLNHARNPVRHRGRGQDDLGFLGQFDNPLDIWREPGIQHLITLIEDQELDTAQGQPATRHHVEDAAGSANHEVDAIP